MSLEKQLNMETTNQNPAVVPPQTPSAPFPVKNQQIQKLIEFMTTLKPQTKLLIGIAATMLTIIVALLLFLPKRNAPVAVLPTVPPVSTVSASLTPRETSEFAKTDAFRQFDTDLENFQNDNNTVDVSETLLSFPLLDMQVNFDK